MDRQFQRPGVQHQHPSYSQSTSPYPPTSSTPTAAGQKRTADQAVLSQDIDDQANDSFDPGEGVEVKDETDSIADQASRLTAGIQGRKNRSAAPPLKRGTACMLCRKRKLRCDGVRPKCGTCLRLSHECVFGDPAQEKIQAKTRELEDRIRSLEAELETYRSAETSAPQQQRHQPHLLNGSQFDMNSVSPSSASTSRPQNDRTASYQALHMSNVDNQGFPSPLLNTPGGGGGGGGGGGYPGFGPPPPGQNSSYPQHHQAGPPLDSPYLAFSQHDDPSRPSRHHHPNSFGRPDSEAFPLPPPQDNPNGFLSRLPVPGSSNHGGSPGHSPIGGVTQQQAHLQSFPFPMNPTPQLSDLINPQHYSPVAPSYHQSNEDGSPVSIHQISPIVAANGGYHNDNHNGYGGLGLPSSNRQPFDGQSSLASPERLEDMKKQSNGGQGGGGGELSTLWITADLPEIDLMVELANIYFQTIHQHLPFLHRPRFLYTLRHPASLSSPPSLSLIFAVLAIACAYHDSPQIRSLQTRWYASAREKVEVAIQAGIRPQGGRVASLTVEMVQALCLLALLEMGQSDHQRAFLSIGQAVRIAAMLGLHRMDEDRLSERCGTSGDKRLRPPALHELPTDGVLLEECRRTMCAVIVLDRFEQGCVGWPSAIAEPDLRILLPCDEALYESGICTSEDNPMWWPTGGLEAEDQETMKEGNERKRVGTFAWLCRAAWVGGRVQLETYRPSGPPAGGPWNKNVAMDPLFSTSDMLEMDKLLDFVRSKLGQMAAMKASQHKGVDGPVIMTLLLVNCLFVNLHHLRGASGLSQLPFDPNAPIFIGTAEYSMQRCWEAIHSLYEIVSQLAGYENAHTSLHQSKINTFTAFVPYVLYCVAFPAKFTIGDWTALVNSRDRTENVPAHLSRPDIPRGDDVFPPAYFEQRLKMVDALCDAMERVGAVWPIGHKFAKMIAGDRIRLAERTYQRDHAHNAGGGSSQTTPASQSSQHLHPHHQQQQQGYQTSPTTLHSDQGY